MSGARLFVSACVAQGVRVVRFELWRSGCPRAPPPRRVAPANIAASAWRGEAWRVGCSDELVELGDHSCRVRQPLPPSVSASGAAICDGDDGKRRSCHVREKRLGQTMRCGCWVRRRVALTAMASWLLWWQHSVGNAKPLNSRRRLQPRRTLRRAGSRPLWRRSLRALRRRAIMLNLYMTHSVEISASCGYW